MLTIVAVAVVLLSPLQFGGFAPVVFAVLGMNALVCILTNQRFERVSPAFRQLAPLISTAEALQDLGGEAIRAKVPGLRRLKTIARWVSDDPFVLGSQASPLASIASAFANAAYLYLNLMFLLDASAIVFGARELRDHTGGLLHVLAAIGDVDAAVSVSSFRASTTGWTRPRFVPSGAPGRLRGVRHPLVEDAVGNSIHLLPPHGVLVTGSNMSGKSTFLRTLGVSAVLAQTINTCLADEYSAPVFLVRSCIGRTDDLVQGKSYYLVEVQALLDLVRASADSHPHLFLLDELFRGTNAVERIAAGEAVLHELLDDTNSKPHVVIAATHDGELVDLLQDTYVALHFGDSLGPNGLTFDYKLRPGPATSRNAITLLELQGAPERLIRRASDRAAELDRERTRRVEQ